MKNNYYHNISSSNIPVMYIKWDLGNFRSKFSSTHISLLKLRKLFPNRHPPPPPKKKKHFIPFFAGDFYSNWKKEYNPYYKPFPQASAFRDWPLKYINYTTFSGEIIPDISDMKEIQGFWHDPLSTGLMHKNFYFITFLPPTLWCKWIELTIGAS